MSNPPLSIRAMQALAENRGGACLSTDYRNNKTKLLWRCAGGHEWWARPDMVGRRVKPNWCAECAQKKPKTREEIARLAVPFGGRLVSVHAKGVQRRFWWCCREGHEFRMTPNNVKFGHWCPRCWEQRRPEVSARNSREGHARRRQRSKTTPHTIAG